MNKERMITSERGNQISEEVLDEVFDILNLALEDYFRIIELRGKSFLIKSMKIGYKIDDGELDIMILAKKE